MSGFIGIISTQLRTADKEILDRSMEVIASTCGDYLGEWHSNQADLRFGWLKTGDDTTEERLPLTTDNSLCITGDVRLDNRVELIKKLNAFFDGINNTTPDSWLLLYAYQHWGENCLQHISGDYAFAIWNEQTSYLFCARDHFGVIPFYYTESDNSFLFTNFYRSFKDTPHVTAGLDDTVLQDYLATGINRRFDRTIYRKIKKLPPAHQLVYKEGKIHISRYWEIPAATRPIRYQTTSEYVSHFHRLFEQSVKDRTRSRKIASSLSGGMDSSSVTATAKKVQDDLYGSEHSLVAFNIRYQELIIENEGYFADLIASHLKIPARQYIGEDYISNIIQSSSGWLPEPAGIPEATAESQILADAAAFSGVYLTGFGGDPLFEYEPFSRKIHAAQGNLLQPFLDDLMYHKTFGYLPLAIWRKIKKWTGKASITNAGMPSWCGSPFFHQGDRSGKNEVTIRSYFGMSENPFWSWLFETTHPGFTGNKIKIRHPFFSLDLLLFVLALPPHLLYKKSLLRMAMGPYLPAEIVKRPKTILFGNPLVQNLRTPDMRNKIEKKVLESADFLTGRIDVQRLKSAIRDLGDTSGPNNNFLSVLHVLAWKNNHSL
ncbi:asparagine synthetase B family protein [Chitinophaga sp. 22536]|uniref:asparagine synthetase B family protein n=1 Tax=unclassified Chitinophaga TaxID=2619133 RepID=UPI003F848870